jgi:hypothetical protein
VLWTVLVGVALTALTPPDGEPMVKLLEVTDAADAGRAVIAVRVPKDARATPRTLATSLARFHGGPADIVGEYLVCI